MTPGKTVRWGGVERVALPNEAVTALGLLFKLEAPVRIGEFSVRVWRPQSPAVPPAANGAWPQFKRNAQRTGDALDEDLQLPLRRIGGVRLRCPIYASPAVLDGVAIVQDAGGQVVCYDHRQRKIVWLARLDGVANHSSPAIKDTSGHPCEAGHVRVGRGNGARASNVQGHAGGERDPTVIQHANVASRECRGSDRGAPTWEMCEQRPATADEQRPVFF